MWKPRPKPLLLLAAISLCVSALSSPCTAAGGGKPLVTAVTKDAATSLYTAPLSAGGHPLVLDLSIPIISLTTCYSGTVTTTLSANATNGINPLFPVSFPASATCAPRPPYRLPAGAVGIAGLAPSSHSSSFPEQVARTQKVATTVALCLPSDGKTTSGNGMGVAIFGGGPVFFIPPDRGDFTTQLAGTAPLHASRSSPGYFVTATAINVERTQIGATGPFAVALSSAVPYTALRRDVYAPLVKAFDEAAGGPDFSSFMSRVAAVAPFERCYNSTQLPQTRLGYFVPQIDVVLEGGDTFMVLGGNSMVQVGADTACLGFVQQADGGGGQAPPAILLGGFQLENHLLLLDEKKQQLGFTTFLPAIGLSCSSFNFTLAA